jgi:thioredoxin 1
VPAVLPHLEQSPGPVGWAGMTAVALTADTFEKTVVDNGIVLVDFWASWCGPCLQFAPVFEAASQEHADVVFGKVDTEAEQALAAAAQITSIPTLMAFRDGILVFNQPGALPAPALEQVISAVKDLDMDDVRAQIAAREQGAQEG